MEFKPHSMVFIIAAWSFGTVKKIAGYKPFNEILKKGILKPGQAVLTSGGDTSRPEERGFTVRFVNEKEWDVHIKLIKYRR